MRRLSLAVFVASLLLVVGCATNRAVYNSLASIKASTDATLLSYFTLVAKGECKTNGVPMVARAYDTFQVAFSAAVQVAQFNTNTIAPPEVLSAATKVSSAIVTAKGMQ